MPPCGWCLHEGNPINLAETESAWEKIGMNLEKQVAAAETRLAVALEKDVAAHQAVMTAEFRHQEVVRELMQELDARRWRERIEDIFVGV